MANQSCNNNKWCSTFHGIREVLDLVQRHALLAQKESAKALGDYTETMKIVNQFQPLTSVGWMSKGVINAQDVQGKPAEEALSRQHQLPLHPGSQITLPQVIASVCNPYLGNMKLPYFYTTVR